MIGHGFNSEVIQNKTMASSFDSQQVKENLNSFQIASPISDGSVGKKVIQLKKILIDNKIHLDIDISWKRTNDAWEWSNTTKWTSETDN